MSVDGKFYFIGCSHWKPSHPKYSHTFFRIPGLVNEDCLKQLLEFHTIDSEDSQAFVRDCAFVNTPRIGLKQKKCREL